MARTRRQSLLRADVLAPWLSLLFILLVWWAGAKTVAWFRAAPASPSVEHHPLRPEPVAQPAPAPPDDPVIAAPPAPASISPVTTISGGDVANLQSRELLIPVRGLTKDDLASSFHQQRNGREHEAMDILAPRGTDVLAVEDGHVAKLFVSDRGGLTIYQFDPSDLFVYYYAHLERYAPGLQEGQAVRRGDVIGYVGTSGNAPKETPHLHFAIVKLGPDRRWWEGTPLDPFLVWQ